MGPATAVVAAAAPGAAWLRRRRGSGVSVALAAAWLRCGCDGGVATTLLLLLL